MERVVGHRGLLRRTRTWARRQRARRLVLPLPGEDLEPDAVRILEEEAARAGAGGVRDAVRRGECARQGRAAGPRRPRPVERVDPKGEMVQARPIGGECAVALLPEREHHGVESEPRKANRAAARFRSPEQIEAEHSLVERDGTVEIADVEADVARDVRDATGMSSRGCLLVVLSPLNQCDDGK